MLLIEIDVIRLQPPQTVFHSPHDVTPRRALLGAIIAHRHAEFGGKHHILAPIAQYIAEHDLGAAAVGIHVGCIKQGDTEIERLVDDFSRRLRVAAAAKIVAADADHGHTQAGAAEIANLHDKKTLSRCCARCASAHCACSYIKLQARVDQTCMRE